MTQGEFGLLEAIALPVIFLAGCLFAAQNVLQRRSHRIARRTWTHAMAQVVSVEYRSSGYGIEVAGHHIATSGSSAYYPTLRFVTEAGVEIVGEPLVPCGDGQQAPRIGKPVAVLYDPSCPHAFHTKSRTSLRLGTLVALVGVVVPLVFLAAVVRG